MKRFFVVSMLVVSMTLSLFDTAVLAKSSVSTTKSQTVKSKTKTASKAKPKKTTTSKTKKLAKGKAKSASKSKPKTTSKSKTKTTSKSKTKSIKSASKSKAKSTSKNKTKSTKSTKTTSKSKTASTTKKSSKAKVKPTTKKAVTKPASRKPAASRGTQSFDASRIIQFGLTFKGTKYKFGGTTPSGFDCSGFTSYVFKHAAGIELPHSSGGQASMGTAVAKSDLLPGDIVYFTTYKSGPSHVGIYVGDNKFMHASSSKGITVTSLSETYYAKRYLGARRIR